MNIIEHKIIGNYEAKIRLVNTHSTFSARIYFSGDRNIDKAGFLDISQDNFAWISSNKIEKRIIKRMKKASRIMITAYNKSGSQTIDHYSLMGFTKAYNAAKKSCT